MNLNLFPLGWIHTLACVVALALGAYVLATRKGTSRHRRLGRVYLIAQIVLNVTALGIYRRHVFFFPHILAIVTLALIGIGWASARTKWPRPVWKYIHLSAMILTYYLLIGGGVNEAYLRINILHAYVTHHGGQIINVTHGVVLTAFLIVLIGWNGVEIIRALRRRRRRAAVEGEQVVGHCRISSVG